MMMILVSISFSRCLSDKVILLFSEARNGWIPIQGYPPASDIWRCYSPDETLNHMKYSKEILVSGGHLPFYKSCWQITSNSSDMFGWIRLLIRIPNENHIHGLILAHGCLRFSSVLFVNTNGDMIVVFPHKNFISARTADFTKWGLYTRVILVLLTVMLPCLSYLLPLFLATWCAVIDFGTQKGIGVMSPDDFFRDVCSVLIRSTADPTPRNRVEKWNCSSIQLRQCHHFCTLLRALYTLQILFEIWFLIPPGISCSSQVASSFG